MAGLANRFDRFQNTFKPMSPLREQHWMCSLLNLAQQHQVSL